MLRTCACGCKRLVKNPKRYRYRQGHGTRGQRRAAKITLLNLQGIRKKLKDPRYNRAMIAKFYGVSKNCIRDIEKGVTWKNIG